MDKSRGGLSASRDHSVHTCMINANAKVVNSGVLGNQADRFSSRS